MKLYNQDFENRLNKRFVQSLLYSLSNVRGNVLMLCGPALASHLHDAKTILSYCNKKSKCIIYEQKREMFEELQEKLKYLNPSFTVELNKGNIVDAKMQRFVDYDACATVKTSLPQIKVIYSKMNKKFSNKRYKNIIVTCALRPTGKKETIDILCKTFGMPNNFKKTDVKLGSTSRLYESKNKNYIARHFSYRDGDPMISFSFQWK